MGRMKFFAAAFVALVSIGWIPFQNVSDNSSDSETPCIVVDSDNHAHVLWSDTKSGNWATYYSENTLGTWSIAELINNASYVSTKPDLDIDTRGNLHALWRHRTIATTFSLKYSVRNGTWSTPSTLPLPTNLDFGVLCVNLMNLPHVLYIQANLENYCYNDGFTWISSSNVFGLSTKSNWPHLEVDSFGVLHGVCSNNSLGNYNIYYSYKTPTLAWNAGLLIQETTGDSLIPRIALDKNNDIHMVYQDNVDGSNNIYYTKYSYSTHVWNSPIKIFDSLNDSITPDIAVDSSNNPHVVFSDNKTLMYQVYYFNSDGVSWTTPVNISDCPGDALYPRIALDSDDVCHVVWENNLGGPKEIYYTTNKEFVIPVLNWFGCMIVMILFSCLSYWVICVLTSRNSVHN